MTIYDWAREKAENLAVYLTQHEKGKVPKEITYVIEQAFLEAADKALEEAAELCRRKYPCDDPWHDDRYCARCSAIQDGADMLEEEILSLRSKKAK